MLTLDESLDHAILNMILKRPQHSSIERELTELAFQTTTYIQNQGKQKIAEPINRRLVILKNLLWESQHELARGAELHYFFANACDLFEKRFDYSTYICEYLLHATGPLDSYEALVQRQFKDMSFILARMFQSELVRYETYPKRLQACLNTLTMLEQDVSGSIKELLRTEKDPAILFDKAVGPINHIMESFKNDPRYFALRCSLLPTSSERSEILFLSIVQLNEIIFSLATEGFRWILGYIEDNKVAEEAIEVATRLCEVTQLSIFCVSILNDFTHGEFLLFREATANAGAIQSRKYKELEVYTSKHIQERIEQKAFDAVPYLKDLSHNAKLHLYTRIQELADCEDTRMLKLRLDQYEKIILDWKRFHLYIARSRLLNHGFPDSDHIDHYLSSSIRTTFRDNTRRAVNTEA